MNFCLRAILVLLLQGVIYGGVTAQVTDTASWWCYMKGRTTGNGLSIPGNLGQPEDQNAPGASGLGAAWVDKTTGSLWMFGGAGYSAAGGWGYLNTMWRYRPLTNDWTWMHGSKNLAGTGSFTDSAAFDVDNTPGSRAQPAGWTDQSGKFWLYGGGSAAGLLSDLWVFDPATGQWAFVKGDFNQVNRPAVWGSKGTPGKDNTPGGLSAMAYWSDDEGNFWLYGGRRSSSPLLLRNALWKLNPADTTWTWVSGDNDTNRSTVSPGTIEVPGGKPGSRENLAGWSDPDGNFWIFGGSGYDVKDKLGNLNDLWRYNPRSDEWTWMKGSESSEDGGSPGTRGLASVYNTPGSRQTAPHTWKDVNGNTWIFGGRNNTSGTRLYNDLWMHDYKTNNWIWMKGSSSANPGAGYGELLKPAPGNNPAPLHHARVGWTDTCGNFWLFGGATTNDNWLNTLMKLAPPPPVRPSGYELSFPQVCAGAQDLVYTVAQVPDAAYYEWVYTGGGAAYQSRTTTAYNNIRFSKQATGGVLRVRVVNCSGQSGWTDTAVKIVPVPEVTMTPSGTESVCMGDTVTLTAAGGSGAGLIWKKDGSPVGEGPHFSTGEGGRYILEVTDPATGCVSVADAPLQLTVHRNPSATLHAPVADICRGDTVRLSVLSMPGVRYLWKHGQVQLAVSAPYYDAQDEGAYRVVITDDYSGCTDSTNIFSLSVWERPVVQLNPADTAVCEGHQVVLEAVSPDAGLSLLWKKDDTVVGEGMDRLEVSSGGIYTVTAARVQVKACSVTAPPAVVTVHPLPDAGIIRSGDVLRAGSGNAAYQWYHAGEEIPGAVSETLHVTEDGLYSVAVTDNRGCTALSELYFAGNTIVPAEAAQMQVSVYPNPARNMVYIASGRPVQVAMTDVGGRIVRPGQITDKLSLEGLLPGCYFLEITAEDGARIRTEKLVIE